MINFFRKIRRQLANENKFQRYMRYAIGEVILIMLGIFMALQLQNWNEKRKQDAEFKVTLELIYNALKFEVDDFNFHMLRFYPALLYDPDLGCQDLEVYSTGSYPPRLKGLQRRTRQTAIKLPLITPCL